MTSSTEKSVEGPPVVERDTRDRAARQARVTEKTGSALKPPGSIPAPPPPLSAPASGLSAARPVTPAGAKRAVDAPATEAASPPLLGKAAADRYRKKMRDSLTGFVDSPGDAVAGADTVLAEAIEELTEALRRRREEMSRARQSSANNTEELRQALLRYRAFLDSIVVL